MRFERGGRDPLNPAGDLLLRAALEAALAAAREGEEEKEKPAVPAPVALRPFLRFAKLPPRALAATRRALDTDEDFRARVTATVEERDVGRAGWLFLARPSGWEEELASLVARAEQEAEAAVNQRAEHDARRRLAGAEDASRRAEQAAASARAEAAQATAALGEERRARQMASDAAAAAGRRAESLAAERDRAKASAAAAAAEVEALRRRVRQLEVQVGELQASAEVAAPADALGLEQETSPVAPPDREPSVPAALLAVNADVGRALREAARAAARLAEALGAAADPLTGDGGSPEDVRSPALVPVPEVRPARRRSGRPDAVGRQPVRLPPAIFDDSTEAAEYLVRVSGVALVVDGYNVSLSGWPEVPLPDQRRRLVDALTELAARTGADVRVVFDGAEQIMPGVVPTTARAVKVQFSAPGVEADDEVLALVNELPPQRPVVVATSDRRVQQGAARAGANVISSRQLLAVLRR
ncbi:MAG: NYN domain-containing protein [Acidimicrobiales bacterium]